jgi:hypothetical protein
VDLCGDEKRVGFYQQGILVSLSAPFTVLHVEGLIASKPWRRRRSQIWKASPSAHESWTVVGRTVAPLAQRLQTAVARWRCTSQTVENKTATTESRSRLDLTVVGVVTKDFLPLEVSVQNRKFPVLVINFLRVSRCFSPGNFLEDSSGVFIIGDV